MSYKSTISNNTESSPEKPYEEEFPALGSVSAPSVKVWGGTSSFAEKAREWSNYKKDKDLEEETKNKELELMKKVMPKSLPVFSNIRHFVDEKLEEEDDNKPEETEPEEEPWVVVEHKRRYKKRKTMEEIANQEMVSEETSNEPTVWGEEPQLNETCWDDRY